MEWPETAIRKIFKYSDLNECIVLHSLFRLDAHIWMRKMTTYKDLEGLKTIVFYVALHNPGHHTSGQTIPRNVYNFVFGCMFSGMKISDHMKKRILFNAVKSGHKNMVKYLLKNGISIYATDRGFNILHCAIMYKRKNIIALALERGVSIKTRDYYGNTPLFLAVCSDDLILVEVLIKMGADVNVKNGYKQSPLHQAVKKGYLQIVILLIKHGADLTCINKDKLSPLDLALKRGHNNIADVITSGT